MSRTVERVPGVRLQKILSAAGVASRRAAERLMQEGRVTVNGRAVTELGSRADPAQDVVRVDGRRVSLDQRRRYLLVNKPRGYLTTRYDPQQRKTVLDLIPRVRQYVYPVGRLDCDSEGLLLLTNDGELAELLTHPGHAVERVYEAVLRGVPSATELRRLSSGVSLDGCRTAPARVRLLGGHRRPPAGSGQGRDQSRVQIMLREGRNRQVRRMFEAIGHQVIRLRRVRLGPLLARGLKPGDHRELTRAEVEALHRAALPSRAPTTLTKKIGRKR
jgi:23S rRNA pseudouridine2605 synthase